MRVYIDLNAAERAICDEVTAKWWYPPIGPDNPTGQEAVLLSAQESIRGLHKYETVVGVNTAAITEAIVSRYRYLVWLQEE
jgi:hypothetical protein